MLSSQVKDSETCKVTMDFDPASGNPDSLLTISCPMFPIQPIGSGTSLKVADQFVNSLSEQHASYVQPVELGSGEFNGQHAEPSSSSSYHCAGHEQDGGENLKELNELYDVNYTIKGSRGLAVNCLPLNTKARWLATADKSEDHTRNSLSVPAYNRGGNTFASTESGNNTSDLNSLESVAKGNHRHRSQSGYSKRSSSEYEVSTTDLWTSDSCVDHEKTTNPGKTNSKCPMRADQRVTCSSADDDGEPVSEMSHIEKEDGEITDDEPDNSAQPDLPDFRSREQSCSPDNNCRVDRTPPGVASSEISSTNFRWNHPYPPNYRGGRGWGWRGNSRGGGGSYRPFKFRGRGQRGSYWQRDPPPLPKQPDPSEFKSREKSCSPDREESHVDSSSGVSSGSRWKAKELVVGSPITSDEDDNIGGNNSNHSSPFFKESDAARFRLRSNSPVCQKDEKKDNECKEKGSRRRSSSTSSFSSSSSDSEQRRSYQSHQQGTKKKVLCFT